LPKVSVGGQLRNRICKAHRVVLRNETAVLAIDDDISAARNVRRHDGPRGSGRLEKRFRDPLSVERGENANMSARPNGGNVGDESEPLDRSVALPRLEFFPRMRTGVL